MAQISKTKVIKERIDPKTGDTIRVSKETSFIVERISADGKVKHREVSGELYFSSSKNEVKKLRQQFINRITKMVQDLELHYVYGNSLIKCLKNYKVNDTVDKRLRNKDFIGHRDELELKFDHKHDVADDKEALKYKDDLTRLGLYQEIVQVIDSLNLDEHWKSEIIKCFNQAYSSMWQTWPKQVLKDAELRKGILRNKACIRKWFEKWDAKYGKRRPYYEIEKIPIEKIVAFYKEKCAEAEMM